MLFGIRKIRGLQLLDTPQVCQGDTEAALYTKSKWILYWNP